MAPRTGTYGDPPFSLRLPPAMAAELAQAAQREGRTKGNLVRRFILRGLAQLREGKEGEGDEHAAGPTARDGDQG